LVAEEGEFRLVEAEARRFREVEELEVDPESLVEVLLSQLRQTAWPKSDKLG